MASLTPPSLKSPEQTSAGQTLAAWLDAWNATLASGDPAAATGLFVPDGFWRDMAAFTWNIHTAEGQDAIRTMLASCLSRTRPAAWTPSGPPHEHDGIVEATLTFETAAGRGTGVVRLRDGRCWTLLTVLTALNGHEEAIRAQRPVGQPTNAYHPNREPWGVRRQRERAAIGNTEQPYCLVIGAGLSGLALGARLKALNVPTLLIDRQARPSDTWRNRYETLTLNSPSSADHMPYMPFPETWPLFPSKDQIANWLDSYATIMDLDIWTEAACQSAAFNEEAGEWRVEVMHRGQAITLRPKHLVFATSLLGTPHTPDFPGTGTFTGEQIHSSAIRSVSGFRGRRCAVIGADVSAQDLSAALWEAGADVTLVQRSPTIVMRRETLLAGFSPMFSDEAVARGITPDVADLLFASVPLRVMERQQQAATAAIREQEAEYYEDLANAGLNLHFGEDGAGLVSQLFRRASGYYVDVGTSGLMIDGKVKVRSRVGVEAITPNGLMLSDGSDLPADVIVYATGFNRMKTAASELLGPEVMQRVGQIYGYGSGVRGDPGPWEGEQRNLWKPTRQRSLWFNAGGFIHARFYSRVLALQIKARQVGLSTPVYGMPQQA